MFMFSLCSVEVSFSRLLPEVGVKSRGEAELLVLAAVGGAKLQLEAVVLSEADFVAESELLSGPELAPAQLQGDAGLGPGLLIH